MAKTLRWTESGWADLEAVADYIARDSRYYAAAFVREVRDAARSLRRFAERGTVVAELDDPSIREVYVRRYRLIYRVEPKTVSVLAFIHGARDLAALWKRERR
jgi:plasmid stabilization system protein ParE